MTEESVSLVIPLALDSSLAEFSLHARDLGGVDGLGLAAWRYRPAGRAAPALWRRRTGRDQSIDEDAGRVHLLRSRAWCGTGYIDDWRHDGLFHYTGEGQRGDQQMRAGNKAVPNTARTAGRFGCSTVSAAKSRTSAIGEVMTFDMRAQRQSRVVARTIRGVWYDRTGQMLSGHHVLACPLAFLSQRASESGGMLMLATET